jgi:predicted ATPase
LRFTRLKLENWRNFLAVDVPLLTRVFVVGPNASGKSNLLDALRFLRDIADPQGGFQRAVLSATRGSVSQLRSLHARRYPNVAVEVEMDLDDGERWTYRLEFTQDNQRRPVVQTETVFHGEELVLKRPDEDDAQDPSRLTQTHLEQVNANKHFRRIANFLAQVRYLHLVPQIVREPERSSGRAADPFGGDFLEQLARAHKTQKRIFESRLKRINSALRVAVPQLKEMRLERDLRGTPHLMGLYQHWRPKAGWQNERQLSDGTLRLFGLLWSFLDGTGPLLLEEPEISLHAGVIQYIPSTMARLGRKYGRQIFISTHSSELLSDVGIAPEEVLVLKPSKEDTTVEIASSNKQVRALLRNGLSMADAVLPRTAPERAEQLALFGD